MNPVHSIKSATSAQTTYYAESTTNPSNLTQLFTSAIGENEQASNLKSCKVKQHLSWEPYLSLEEVASYAFISKLVQKPMIFKSLENANLSGKNCLDMGCRDGEITAFLAQTAKQVIGLDVSNWMIKFANDHYAKSHFNLTFIQGDTSTQFPQKFDFILCANYLHWLKSPEEGLKSLYHNLNNEGEALIIAPEKTNSSVLGQAIGQVLTKDKWKEIFSSLLTGNSATQLFSKDELESQLQAIGFVNVHVKSITENKTFANENEFKEWLMASVTLAKRLPMNLREEFAEELVFAIAKKLNVQPGEEINYSASMLEAKVKKN